MTWSDCTTTHARAYCDTRGVCAPLFRFPNAPDSSPSAGALACPEVVGMAGSRCDAGCRHPALTCWARDPDDSDTVPDLDGWQMCGPCAERHGPMLEAMGYELLVDERGEGHDGDHATTPAGTAV